MAAACMSALVWAACASQPGDGYVPQDGVSPAASAAPVAQVDPDPDAPGATMAALKEVARVELESGGSVTFYDVDGDLLVQDTAEEIGSPPLHDVDLSNVTGMELFKALAPEREVPELLRKRHAAQAGAIGRKNVDEVREVPVRAAVPVRKSAYNQCRDLTEAWGGTHELKDSRSQEKYFIYTDWAYWIHARYYSQYEANRGGDPYRFYATDSQATRFESCRDATNGTWKVRWATKVWRGCGGDCWNECCWGGDWVYGPVYTMASNAKVIGFTFLPGSTRKVAWYTQARGGSPNTGATAISILSPI